MAGDSGEITFFRSRFNVLAASVVWVLCAAAATAVLMAYSRTDSLTLLAPVVVVAFLSWAILWRPLVRVDDDGVRLVNVTKTVDIPWEALIQVDTRYSLTLCTPHGRYPAAAAPAPGRVNMTFVRSEMPGTRGSSERGARPSDSTRTDSGAAARLVKDRWDELSAAGRIELGVADTTAVPQRWHWRSIAVGVLLVAASAVIVALG